MAQVKNNRGLVRQLGNEILRIDNYRIGNAHLCDRKTKIVTVERIPDGPCLFARNIL